MTRAPASKTSEYGTSGAPPLVLIVDDDDRNRRLLRALLVAEGWATVEAEDGPAALARVAAAAPDVVLLDVMMPAMDGYAVLRALKSDPATHRIPVVLLTALADRDARLRGLAEGADDFVTKPADRAELAVRVRNLLHVKHYGDLLANRNEWLEQRVRERTAELRLSHIETIVTLSRAAEYKDRETGAHVQRISYYAHALASALGQTSEFADAMYHASPMHDIGKIGIPDAVLTKRGALTADEWSVMKTHTTLGWQLLREGSTPLMRLGAEIALGHHERWDGSGYPGGLRGEAIPLSARIMTVCDQYDALRSPRVYKTPLDHAAAVRILEHGDGRTRPEHFDPAVLAAFMRIAESFDAIFTRYGD